MIIRISAEHEPTVWLHEPEDFTSFHVELVGIDEKELPQIVAASGLGSATADGHINVHVTALKGLAGERDDGWLAGLDAMLRYAGSKGWMPDNEHVRAHCERVQWRPTPLHPRRIGIEAR